MIVFKCLVNGPIDEGARQRVTQGLRRIYRDTFGEAGAPLRAEFTEIAPGLWFTAGQPSRASMVMGTVPAGTSQAQRVEVMQAICRMFSDETGRSYDDVMVVAADPKAG